MKKEVEIPKGIEIEVSGSTVTVKANGKQESREFKARKVKISKKDRVIEISGTDEKRKTNAMVNTIASHIRNMALGLQHGYEYRLKAVFSHFPMTIKAEGKSMVISNFAGEKKPRVSEIKGENTSVRVKGKDITITGPNKEMVSQTAANLEKIARVRKKDLRVFQDGIYLVSKGLAEEKGGGEKDA